MVSGHALSPSDLDGVFRALADETRRDIMARVLGGEEMSVSALARRYGMSLAAVQKHVGVLVRAKLVTKHARGRERIVRADARRLSRARVALTSLEDLWRNRHHQLDAILAEPIPGETADAAQLHHL